MLFDALYDDLCKATIILRNHRKALNNGPGINGQVRQSRHVITTEHVGVDVVDWLRDGGSIVGIWRRYGGSIALRRIGQLGVCGTLRVERHRGAYSSNRSLEEGGCEYNDTVEERPKSWLYASQPRGKPEALLLCSSQTFLTAGGAPQKTGCTTGAREMVVDDEVVEGACSHRPAD